LKEEKKLILTESIKLTRSIEMLIIVLIEFN